MPDDYELLYLASDDDKIIEILYNKYRNFINYKVSKYCQEKNNNQDYLNEATLAFYKAVENYKDNNKFVTLLNVCIDRSLQKYKNKTNRKKDEILNNAVSIEENVLLIDNKYNPERIILGEERYKEIKNGIISILNYDEELVFLLREQNFTLKEICQILNVNIEVIYRIIRRIKEKINKFSKKY